MSKSVTFRPKSREPLARLALAVAPSSLAGLLGLGLLGANAQAADFCISCQGPEAHYVCSFEGVPAGSQDPRLKLLCITTLAGQGGHASCSVERVQAAPCKGERKVLATPEGLGTSGPVDAAAPAEAPSATESGAQNNVPSSGTTEAATPEAGTPAADETAEPKSADGSATAEAGTNGEVKSGKSAESALQKAGDAVGQAAKKTWNCISTFFGSC